MAIDTSKVVVGGLVAGLVANVVGFVGFLLVWLYAAMRARFGPGPRTAVYAALVVWLCGFLFHLDWLLVGMMTPATYAMASLAALVQVVAAAMAGSMLYKESAAVA